MGNQFYELEDIFAMASQHAYDLPSAPAAETAVAEQPGFFGEVAKAVIALFAPAHDDYPETGFQPFTGELSRNH